jgi:hypothetical protein
MGRGVRYSALFSKVQYNLGAWGEEMNTYLSELIHDNNSWAP